MAKEVKETARQRRARTSKFNRRDENARTGSFEIMALFDGNPKPQSAPFPNLSAALARFDRLSTNPALTVVKLIEFTTLRGADDNQAGTRINVLHQLNRTHQEFANGKHPWWEARA